jgi:hypothetical protein
MILLGCGVSRGHEEGPPVRAKATKPAARISKAQPCLYTWSPGRVPPRPRLRPPIIYRPAGHGTIRRTPATPNGRSSPHTCPPAPAGAAPSSTRAATLWTRSATSTGRDVNGTPCPRTSRTTSWSTTTSRPGPPTAPSTGCTTTYANGSAAHSKTNAPARQRYVAFTDVAGTRAPRDRFQAAQPCALSRVRHTACFHGRRGAGRELFVVHAGSDEDEALTLSRS